MTTALSLDAREQIAQATLEPMMKFEKTDGIIELASSGCCCPPGEIRRGGQHTNCGTRWWRIVGKPWHPMHSFTSAALLANCANTVAEFEEAMQ
jgi:hypothetical protein